MSKRDRLVRRGLVALAAFGLAAALLAAGPVSAAQAADTYQVRFVATPAESVVPSFATVSGDLLSWTGSYKGTAKMYAFDLVAGQNEWINPGPSGSYYNPAAEGQYVVFQGSITGDYDDIYLYDAETKNVRRISATGLEGDRNDWNPRIQGGRVVYEKDTLDPAAGSGIYLYDISTSDTTKIIAGPEYRDPDIWGDYVVCVKSVPSTLGPNATEVILFNLNTSESKVIGSADKNNEHPRIDEGRVVWSAGDVWTPENPNTWPSTYQIYLYDIVTGETSVLTDNLVGNFNPSIAGDLVAWQTCTPAAVKAYRISSRETLTVSPEGDRPRSPEVEGTRIAWYGTKGLYYAVPTSEATRFPDVPTGHHYLTAIEGVAEQGIMTGYGSGLFGPNDWLIRQQFAKMIDLAMGYEVTENDVFDFADDPPVVHLPNELYPYHYIAAGALKGVLQGLSDGTFRPLYQETRTDAVQTVVRAGGDALQAPPPEYTSQLTDPDLVVVEAYRIAEYNGLLDNIVGPDGTLASWDPQAPATRAEIAQLLWNLLAKVRPSA